MAAMNFPSSPSNGDTYTNPDTGVTYTYDGTDAKWKTTVTSNAFLPLSGGTLTGALNVADIKHPSSGSNNVVLASDGSATIATLNSTTITGTTIQGVIKRVTAVASTSGTSIDFTGIPSWTKRITILFNGVSTNGTSVVQARLGTSSGVVSTGYYGSAGGYLNGLSPLVTQIANGAGCPIAPDSLSGFGRHGQLVITNYTGNTWSMTLNGADDGSARVFTSAVSVSLSAALDRVRITTVNGTDAFDQGQIGLIYEG